MLLLLLPSSSSPGMRQVMVITSMTGGAARGSIFPDPAAGVVVALGGIARPMMPRGKVSRSGMSMAANGDLLPSKR